MLLFSVSVWAQTLAYNVMKGTQKIGSLTAVRKQRNDTVNYEIRSQVVFKLLFSFKVGFTYYSRYKKDTLLKEYNFSTLNGGIQKEVKLTKENENYSLTLDDKHIHVEGIITYSVGTIYFREPKDQQKIYSPRFGKYLVFKQVEKGKYEMDSPDGLNVYTYVNGVCVKVSVYRYYSSFSFEITPESLQVVKGNFGVR